MSTETHSSDELPEGWSRPRPEHLPHPSIWPAALALGATLLVWGIVTQLLVAGTGALVFIVALTGWIHDIRKEHHELEHSERSQS